MSHADRGRRKGVAAKQRKEKLDFGRAADRQMMAEAEDYLFGGDDEPDAYNDEATHAMALRPRAME